MTKGTATGARGFLYRGKRLVARSRAVYALTTRARTLRLRFARGERLRRGRYVTAVSAVIDGQRVTRARQIRLR